ncbi:hypothetical protein [Mycoplasmopsis primatum]|uniref:hypothetical protein n=1 Tax=Mycoplasmopsis primatum TaxID=55604 RepID=UPI0004970E0E|nr:hypothetical protein [Mycoplasmopsis primatum]
MKREKWSFKKIKSLVNKYNCRIDSIDCDNNKIFVNLSKYDNFIGSIAIDSNNLITSVRLNKHLNYLVGSLSNN